MRALRSHLTVILFFFLFATTCVAQQVTAKHNVNLRSDPSTNNPPVELIQSGASLTLVDSSPQGGYYHVSAADGKTGWVWSRNLTLSSSTPPTPSSNGGTQTASTECDATLWDHVYNPSRLIVKQQCVAVTGTIVDATNGAHPDGVRHEADGDTHGWLKVDAGFENLLNAGNMSDEGGNLVFEIVCKFKVTQQDAIASCPSTYQSAVQIPPINSHVRIVGTHVQDTNHSKWMEIHPVTSITVIQ